MGVNFSDLIFIIAWIAERENCERNRKKIALFMRIDDKNAPDREDRGAGKTQGSADEIGHGAAGILGVNDAVCFAQFDALE